jgi:hypothetical protein
MVRGAGGDRLSFLADIRALFPQAASNGHQPVAPTDFWSQWRPSGVGYAATALERECAEVASAASGTRNHQLNAAAFSLGQLVAGGELSEEHVVAALTAAAHRAGLTGLEVPRTIGSGLKSGKMSPRTVPERLLVPLGTGAAHVGTHPAHTDPEPEPDEADLVRTHLPRLDWHALWADEDAEEWIVEPLIPARRLVALYSAPKVGKSLLMLELAVAIARGTEALGFTLDRKRRVLYVDFENDPRGDIRERLTAMGFGPDDLEGLDYLSFPALAALDTANGGEQLLAAVRTYQSEVVIIDTVSRAIQGEENENDTWLSFYRHTGKQLKAAGVALVRLDHSGKDESKGQRGGSAKSGDVDMVWRMWRVNDRMFQLDCEAHRMPVTETTLVLHREVVPHLRHRVDAEGRYASWRTKVDEVSDAMDAAGVPRDAGRRVMREALKTTGLRAGDAVLREVIRRRKGIDDDES